MVQDQDSSDQEQVSLRYSHYENKIIAATVVSNDGIACSGELA